MTKPLSYADSGVSIDAGDELVERIKPFAKKTLIPGVLGSIGGFGALFEISKDYKEPVLVTGTDGVGTKLKLAFLLNRHDTVGQDLVGMSVNDILVQGAKSLFFLDYFACGHLDVDVAERVVKGVAHGCELAGCALIGGETAEMPGMYHSKRQQLFSDRYIRGSIVSSDGKTLADAVMEPTRIYVKPVLEAMKSVTIKGMAHITGGGLLENIPRVLPEGTQCVIKAGSWKRPAVFDWLQEEGHIEDHEMYRVFNNGIGMAVIVAAEDAEKAQKALKAAGETVYRIGVIEALPAGEALCVVR